MIIYYPNGSWETDRCGGAEFNSTEIANLWRDLKGKNLSDETVRTIHGLVDYLIDTETEDGTENFEEHCDCDCEECAWNEECEEAEMYNDEDEEEKPAEDTESDEEPAFTCERCEYYCAGFTCPKNIKKKKGCGM